jgi:chemotaxis protein histidine kinase CheA
MIPVHTKRLAAKINQPGGVTEEEAIEAATANLESLRGRTEHELDVTLQQIRAIGHTLQAPPDPMAVRELYSLSNSVVGIAGVYGMSGLSAVAYSLCDLVDKLRTSQTWNAAAVRVHVDSLLLMQGDGPGKAVEQQIQQALRKLLDRVPTGAI